MSRFDGDFNAAGEASVEFEELLAAFGSAAAAGRDRYGAMAQFLSGAEGWRDARAELGGTFAGLGPAAARLTDGKD